MNCGNEIKWRLILAVMNAIKCNCVKKPEKNSGLQRGLNPWPRDTGATLYQLSYEATDVGSRSIVGSYVPVKVKNASDVYEINHMNCGNEIKWRLILAVMNAIKCNCVKKPEKNSGLQRGLNPWPRDTGATLYQLSYEATDVGSRSIVGSYVPVKVKNASDVYEINHMNCGNEIKWRLILAVMNAIKCNCVKKPEKNSGLQRGLNPWPRDTGATLYQLSYEATDVGSRSIVGSYVPVKVKNASDVYEMDHVATCCWRTGQTHATSRNSLRNSFSETRFMVARSPGQTIATYPNIVGSCCDMLLKGWPNARNITQQFQRIFMAPSLLSSRT